MNVRLKKTYAVITLALAAVMLLTGLPMQRAEAAPDDGSIEVQSQVGLGGRYKEEKWYPLRLTLTNNTEENLSGEAVLSVVSQTGMTTDYLVPVDLPAGTPVGITIGLPGTKLLVSESKLRFFEGSYKNGDTIEMSGTTNFTAQSLTGYAIGVVSGDPDTMNFMPMLNQKGYEITVLPIQPDELPEESELLDMLDTLVINDFATTDWSDGVVQAIKDWVARGGTLVLSGGAGYDKTAEAFAELAPVTVSGTAALETAGSLSRASGESLELTAPLTVSAGKLTPGAATVIQEGELPLAATRSYGFGTVLYTAFDPSLEPMSSWPGSAPLWSKLLQHNLSSLQGMGGAVQLGNTYNDNMMWTLTQLVDLFPSIKPPSFGLLVGMFALYVLIVAPILYIVLAKLDRREWGWWLIPSLALLSGVLIFVVGAGDKRNTNVHTIEIVELAADGQAVVSGAAAIFSPNGGALTADFERKQPARLYSDSSMGGNSSLVFNGEYQLRDDGSRMQAIWRNVPYWSTRKLWMDRRVADPAEKGSIGIAYEQENGSNKLVVTNHTTADLTNVSLLMNGSVHPIGDLKQGDSGSIVMPKSITVPQPGVYYSYADSIFPYSGSSNSDSFGRERQMTDNYFNQNNGALFTLDPVVVGYSKDQEAAFETDGGKARTDRLTMWVKRLDPVERSGERVLVPAGAMKPIVTSSTLSYMNHYGNGVVNLSAGEMILEYMTPANYNVAYDKLDIQFNLGYANPNMKWSIWREGTGEWTPIGGALGAPDDYLVDGQTIRIKLESAADGDTIFPYVTLEGEELTP
ncbi:DUF7408 domain-containing protein [Paenibacillus soyae]|uniref:DUF7408 domain-containing protein n=1 Tax=Paenibacillus soyae TaxID=2969249 RepID=A0A9X2MS05_9BACL|nr:hypothetical protein [Paenibacillus soyae]MCR2805109.1 hypothetical protein [Paenibacillus soyae]